MVCRSWSRSFFDSVFAEILQAGGGTDDRHERRAQIVRHGGEQRRAQLLGFGQQPRLFDVRREIGALDRDRDLIRPAHPAGAIDRGASGWARSLKRTASRPTVPRRVFSGRNSQWRRAACRNASPQVLPFFHAHSAAPQSFCVELILRRIAGGDPADAWTGSGSSTSAWELHRRRHVVDRRPQHIVQRGGRGDLAAELVEVGRCAAPTGAWRRSAFAVATPGCRRSRTIAGTGTA